MFLIIHSLLGSLIGLNFNSVLLIILLSLLGHFILDIIPHWDGVIDNKNSKKVVLIVTVDAILSLILVFSLYNVFNSKLLVLGALISVLPDAVKLFKFTRLRKNRILIKYIKFHKKIQGRANFLLGILIQLIIFLILLFKIF